MKIKLILGLALVLGGALNDFGVYAQPTATYMFSDGETLARFPKMQMVNSMLISPDGKTIATLRGENTFWHEGGKPLTLQLWSASSGDLPWNGRTGRCIRALKAQTNAISAMTVSPDGRMLAMASEDTGNSGVCHKIN